MDRWPGGQIVSYQEGSGNDILGERDFIPEIAL